MKRREWMKLLLMCMMAAVLVIGMSACGSSSQGSDEETAAQTQESEAAEDAETEAEAGSEDAETAGGSETAGQASPDFEAELADGTTLTLSEEEGKVILLNFWATWCNPCVEEMPALQHLYDDYNASEVQILAIDCAETKGEVDGFISDNGYTFPFAYDENGAIGELYPTNGIPYTVIIDQKGNIAETFIGSEGADAQYEKYKAAIDKLLGR